LFAGTGAPLLDLFFIRSGLDRHAIVATKAAAQTLGHAAKIAYFALLLQAASPSNQDCLAWLALAAAAICGTYLGRLILDQLSETAFRRSARTLIMSIALGCVGQGLWMFAY
jgi:uncharacterized membrane protein YfcA